MTGLLTDVTRRLYDEIWNGGRYEIAGELVHPEFVHPASLGVHGPEAKLAPIRRYRAFAPDLHVTIDEMLAQGDKVAARTTLTGTDSGGFAGRPATGRPFRCWIVEIFGFRDGLIITDWIGADWLGFFIQLGAVENPWP